MEDKKKQFTLYEYLLFFWRKKLFLILIPLIGLVLGGAASYLVPKKAEYIGQTTVYTGSVYLEILNDRAMVADRYGLNPEDEFYVSANNFLKVKVYGDDESYLENKLEAFRTDLESDLMNEYEKRFQETESIIERTENYLSQLESAQEQYLNRLDSALSEEDSAVFEEIVRQNDVEIASSLAKIDRVNADLAFFEKPEVSSVNVSKVDNHTLEYVIGGFILGLFLAVVMLILWKYILDARRASKID
ncbi:hypothetical protein [Bacillus sp. SG-1]|uniref:hypothetical protein n=1 Tax=Bacillus sp. SG-1 TaxID=161544 RepID=UPI000154513C|nr:hypothetical protein [Bacillus sp. SG-1]EDL64352.1 hypothetical protein BSG1_08691 [Bacillus sp. SG-1]